MAEGRPDEQHVFFYERISPQKTRQYEIILQGARIYAVIYTDKQSGVVTTYQNYLADELKQKVNESLITRKIQCI